MAKWCDVVGNMPLVWSFLRPRSRTQPPRRHYRREMAARRRSLLYLEKAETVPRRVTVVSDHCSIGLGHRALAERSARAQATSCWCARWAFDPACDAGFCSRVRRRYAALGALSEALATLLVPHRSARPAAGDPRWRDQARRVAFENFAFSLPRRRRVFTISACASMPAARRPVGPSGCGKSTLLLLLQRFYDVQDGRILDRRPGLLAGDAGELAGRHCGRSAGHFAVSPLDHGEYPLWSGRRHPMQDVREAIAAANCTTSSKILPEGRDDRRRPGA